MSDKPKAPGVMAIGDVPAEMVEQWGEKWARDWDRRERNRKDRQRVERDRDVRIRTPYLGERCAACLSAEPVYRDDRDDSAFLCWTCHSGRVYGLGKELPPVPMASGDEPLPGRIVLTPRILRHLNYLATRGCGCHEPDEDDTEAEATVDAMRTAALLPPQP